MQIVLEGLTKRYGGLRALDAVSVTIAPGQIVAALGPNGAGKTTLLRCLSSILAPDAGRILFDGERFNRGRIDLRKRLYFLPEFPLLFPRQTVSQYLAMTLTLFGKEPEQVAPIVTEHLHQLDVLALVDTPVGQLSRGQTYKVALTGLLSINPELWLLDEPFASGMDPIGLAYFKQQARLAASQGRIVLYSTQILDIAAKLCDRVCLIYRGKLRVFDALANLHIGTASDGSALEEIFRQLREEDR